MKISVILAIYNEDKYLEKCLISLSNQQKVDYEVLVIDDGSNKKFQVSNFKFKINEKKFRFFQINHSGTAKTRNFGVSKSKGEILVFIDGDMEFTPTFLYELTLPIIEKKAKGTFSSEEFVANWENTWAKCWNYENGLKSNKRIKIQENMTNDFRAILKSEFNRVGGFDNIGYTDTWSLSSKLGYKPVLTQAKYFHYNPESLKEVFFQAIWIGKRQRKFGIIGKLIALIRVSFPISLFIAISKSICFTTPKFATFKLIYDFGIFIGILKSLFSANLKK